MSHGKSVGTVDAVLAALEARRARHLDELLQVLRIPSVSASPEHAVDVRRCADHLVAKLRSAGLPVAEIVDTGGHPVVYAEWCKAPGAPTVLAYGHYDVQPADPVDLWTSPPFEPSIRGGEIYARGAADDKGQLLAHIEAVETLLEIRGVLPVNWKLVAEGEEEVGSLNLEAFLDGNVERLRADVVVVSDSGLIGPGIPSICVGLRGLVYMEVVLEGPSTDLHSGSFGGAIVNPANALATILAGMKDERGRVVIPGFYDRVRPLAEPERDELARLPFDENAFLAATGASALVGEEGFTTVERIWTRPTLDVNGILAGYTGAGSKTILPARASAKVSMRLVPDQDPDEIAAAFARRVRELCPTGVLLDIQRHGGAKPFLLEEKSPALECAKRALEAAMGRPAVLIREGGSIPFVEMISEALGAPCLLVGFGLPDCNAHAPNEHFGVEGYEQAIRTLVLLYDELSRQSTF